MMGFDGQLVNSYTLHQNNQSYFEAFEIVTCRELPDYEGGTIIEEVKTAEEFHNADMMAIDKPFYRVFGIYRNKLRSKKALGDFYRPKEAAIFVQEITGSHVHIYSY